MKASHPTEQGGITILVTLMLLILLTLAAVGMSRNTFREVVISGTARQGAMSRNVADSGVEWSYFWITNNTAPSSATAKKLIALQALLLANDNLSGQCWDPMTLPNPGSVATSAAYAPGGTLQADCQIAIPAGSATTAQGFTLGMTRMGKMPVTDMSQGVTQGAFDPASGATNLQAPDLWAVRSDAQVQVGGVTFISAKEVWITTPVQATPAH